VGRDGRFLRSQQARLNDYIIVAKGTASEMLAAEPVLEDTPASQMRELLLSENFIGPNLVVRVFDCLLSELSGAAQPVPMVALAPGPDDKPALRLSGCAVLDQGRMVGELTEEETLGYLLLMGKARGALIHVTDGDATVSLEVTASAASAACGLNSGEPRYTAALQVTASVRQALGETDLYTSEAAAELAKRCEAEVMRLCGLAIAKAQSLRADILGAGRLFYRTHTGDFAPYADSWPDTFAALPCCVTVKADVSTTGRLTRDIKQQAQQHALEGVQP
jgi:spore germination protein KC